MDTKQLKQKILDLAIRGKLVPQDPNDEPASVLLERIRAEKEQLIAQGKLKKSKSKISDKPHYENVPFEIPENWEWVTLDFVCSKTLFCFQNSSTCFSLSTKLRLLLTFVYLDIVCYLLESYF